MAFSPNVWNQVKNLTKDQIIRALMRDGWVKDPSSRNATIAYIKHGDPSKRVVIHYHPGETCGPKLLKHLLAVIGWSETDLRRLKLVK
ncbi:MAG: type II toxin-antitoxin system HicA family toxin [Terriglobia bacterium]